MIADRLYTLYVNCRDHMTDDDWSRVIDSFDALLKQVKGRVPEMAYKAYLNLALAFLDALEVERKETKTERKNRSAGATENQFSTLI